MSRIKGTPELVAKFKALGGNVNAELVKSVTKWTEQVMTDAIGLCPVDTGELQDSITSFIRRDGDGVEGTVYADKDYAGYVEFGTRYMAAQPFLYPALNNNKPKILDGVKADLTKAIKEVARR